MMGQIRESYLDGDHNSLAGATIGLRQLPEEPVAQNHRGRGYDLPEPGSCNGQLEPSLWGRGEPLLSIPPNALVPEFALCN